MIVVKLDEAIYRRKHMDPDFNSYIAFAGFISKPLLTKCLSRLSYGLTLLKICMKSTFNLWNIFARDGTSFLELDFVYKLLCVLINVAAW